MCSSDPLPAGFEIRFGSLNFQATGNGYLMRITKRDKLRARRQTGPAPVPVAPVVGTPTPASMDVAGPSAPRRHRRSGLRSQQARTERRWAARAATQGDAPTGETTAIPTGERSVSGPRFPIGLRGAMTAYVASSNTDATTRGVRCSRHIPATRDPSASAGDESSHGSASELPPTTSHGYAEWDFSSVPDLVMFRRFLDATDYWFGYSDNSSIGSYDPAQECFVVITNDQANAANAAESSDGEVPPGPGTGPRQGAGPSAPPSSPPRGGDLNAQLAHARELEAKLAEEYRAVRLLRASITGEASSRGERARELGRQARDRINTNFNVDDPNTPRERARSSLPLRHCYGPRSPPRRPRRGTCTTRHRCSLSKRSFSRPKARRPAFVSRGARGTTGARKALNHRCTREVQRNAPPTQGARRSRSGSSTRADKPKMATLATSTTPRGRATRRRGRRRATTPDEAGATIAGRITHRRRSPGNPRVQPGDPHGELPSTLPLAHVDRQIQRGDGPQRMAQRLPPGVPAGQSHHRRGYHP
jgi:hypothetical protein